ncbi:MAG TPA: regulatory protein RecX [Blastocatellia bacterium]|nr:regulatory protein RecX [Blastocatellia bacterium]
MASGRIRNGEQIKRRRREPGGAGNSSSLQQTLAPTPDSSQQGTNQKLLARALKLLTVKSRSEAELRGRLLEKHPVDPVAVEACITRLKEMGLVDDLRFAENYARSRVAVKPVGRSRLARELSARKIDRTTIDRAIDLAFEQQGEDELIDKAIRKHLRLHGYPGDTAGSRKLFSHLVRLGFEFDLVRRKMRSISSGDEFEDFEQ